MSEQTIQYAPPKTSAALADRVAAVLMQVFPRILGGMFVYAAVLKIRNPENLRPVLAFDGIPAGLITPTTWAVIGVELLLGLLLLGFVWKRSLVMVASIALLVVYSAQLGYLLTSDAAPSCGCAQAVLPDQDLAHKHNQMGLIRNILLLLPAIWVWLQLMLENKPVTPAPPAVVGVAPSNP